MTSRYQIVTFLVRPTNALAVGSWLISSIPIKCIEYAPSLCLFAFIALHVYQESLPIFEVLLVQEY